MPKTIPLSGILAWFLMTPVFAQTDAEAPGLDARIAMERELNAAIFNAVGTLVPDGASDEALDALRSAALRGSATAADQLAFLHAYGWHGVTVDIPQAVRYFELAVAQDFITSLIDYGLMLYHGHLVPRDVDRGRALLTRAAELGDIDAKTILIEELRAADDPLSVARADAWVASLGITPDELAMGIEGDDELAAQQMAIGQMSMSTRYRHGLSVPQDDARASDWLDKVDPEYSAVATDAVAMQFGFSGHARSNQHLALAMQKTVVDSGNPTVVNNYVWLLATSKFDELRDGQLAVELMLQLGTDENLQGFMVDTLAAAYAEAGDFEAAVATQDRAIEMFGEGSADIEGALTRRDSYAEGRPWRE